MLSKRLWDVADGAEQSWSAAADATVWQFAVELREQRQRLRERTDALSSRQAMYALICELPVHAEGGQMPPHVG